MRTTSPPHCCCCHGPVTIKMKSTRSSEAPRIQIKIKSNAVIIACRGQQGTRITLLPRSRHRQQVSIKNEKETLSSAAPKQIIRRASGAAGYEDNPTSLLSLLSMGSNKKQKGTLSSVAPRPIIQHVLGAAGYEDNLASPSSLLS